MERERHNDGGAALGGAGRKLLGLKSIRLATHLGIT
jgi:hypothetical protein